MIPTLSDKQKNEYADKGIVSVDVALKTKPDYWEAIIYKGLLYRVKAQVAPPAERKKYLEQAVLLQKQAMDLKKEQTAAQGGAAATTPEAGAAPDAGAAAPGK